MIKLKYKKQVAKIMNRLYRKGLTTTSGGNVSIRHKNIVFITPSQTDKGNMKPSQIGIVNIKGKNLTPTLRLSMETSMHLMIYAAREDITAIVHAHPYTATALSAKDGLINTRINGEARAMLGNPAFVSYETMGTPGLAAAASAAAKNSNALILQHHGILTLGNNLLQAFDRLELMEITARANVLRNIMQISDQIDNENIAIIDRMFDQC